MDIAHLPMLRYFSSVSKFQNCPWALEFSSMSISFKISSSTRVQVKQCCNVWCELINLNIFLKWIAHEFIDWLKQRKILKAFVRLWQTIADLLYVACTVKLLTGLPLRLQLWRQVLEVYEIVALQLWWEMLHLSLESVNWADHIGFVFFLQINIKVIQQVCQIR